MILLFMTQTATPPQKHLTKDVVFHAAMLLLTTKGQTSSLEVKEHLRSIGYWAKQTPISEYLQELQAEHSWNRENTKGYWEYTLNQTTQNTTSSPTSVLSDEIISLIKDTINYNQDVELSDSLSVKLGIDHLDLVSIGLAIDSKYGIHSIKKDWTNVNTVQDVVTLVENLIPKTAPIQPSPAFVATYGNNTSANSAPSKQRKPRAVINDSINPSTSGRVTINIDPKASYTGPDAHVDAKKSSDANDWFVHPAHLVQGTVTDPAVYDQKYTSDNVRTAYARLKGVKFSDVRAKRVKHI